MLSHLSCVWVCATLRTVVRQAPLSIGILQARMLDWVALPSSRGFSWPQIKPAHLTSPALAGRFFTTSATWKDIYMCVCVCVCVCVYSVSYFILYIVCSICFPAELYFTHFPDLISGYKIVCWYKIICSCPIVRCLIFHYIKQHVMTLS